MIQRLSVSILTINFLLLAITPAMANNNSQARLTQIKQQMSTLQQQLKQKQHTSTQLQQQLSTIETHYGEATLKLKHTNQQLAQQHAKLTQLQAQAHDNKHTIQQQQQQLAKQLRTAYMLGQQPYLKLFLDQHQTTLLSRILYYFHCITHNQTITINHLQKHITQLQQQEQLLQQQYHALQQLKQQQNHQQQQLSTLKQTRSQLIKQINQSIKNKHQQLIQLTHNREQLTKTLNKLNHPFANLFASGKDFTHLQGHLRWPTQGKIEQNFNSPMGQGGLRWDGVLIKTHMNQPVYAVADGKVVFAKWLAGYGLLIIINHNHGYMTLYGRNHSLYKKMGDTIHAGELIAATGKSGGYQQPALYFAIRQNAKPLNPNTWCH